MKTAIGIALGAAAALVLFLWILTGIFFVFAFAKRKKPPQKQVGFDPMKLMPSLAPYRGRMDEGRAFYLSQKRETITISASDGVTLYADVLEPEGVPCGTVLLMHGYRGNPANDFGTVFRFYREAGYRIVAPEHRACLRSGGAYITLGAKERFDCRDWAAEIARRYGTETPILLDGISMGAAVVLMATGLSLPQNVFAVVADCGFTSPDEIIRAVVRQTHLLPLYPCIWFAEFFARTLAHYSLKEASTLDAMERCQIPVFFAHGKRDRFVPYEMSVRNFERCAAEKELFTVENAEHGMSFLVETEEYKRRLLAFLEKARARFEAREAERKEQS